MHDQRDWPEISRDWRKDALYNSITPPKAGIDLAQAIRQQDKTLPIIVVTGFADPDLLGEIASCHAMLFEKPIDFQALRTYIDSLYASVERPANKTGESAARAGLGLLGL